MSDLTTTYERFSANSPRARGHTGVLISEEAYSFILTFISYNNATAQEDILVDRIIESDFRRNRKIALEFTTPIILTQKFE